MGQKPGQFEAPWENLCKQREMPRWRRYKKCACKLQTHGEKKPDEETTAGVELGGTARQTCIRPSCK